MNLGASLIIKNSAQSSWPGNFKINNDGTLYVKRIKV